MQGEANARAFTAKLQALQSRADKAQGKSSAQKHRHYNDTVYYQDWKNRNPRVFEKYSNCDEEMVIRNGRVECEGREGAKENGSTDAMV